MTGYKVRIGKAYVRYVSRVTKNFSLYKKDENGKFLAREDVETVKEIVGPEAPITVEEYDLIWQKVE